MRARARRPVSGGPHARAARPCVRAQVMEKCGQHPSDAEVEDMIRAYDIDKNGELSVEEFLELMAKQVVGPTKKEMLDEMFKVFDRNKDGFISWDELAAVMKEAGQDLSEDEARAMLLEADTDGDKKLNPEEFARIADFILKM
jgi:Ca2+-binding EF-hand superfamily protein